MLKQIIIPYDTRLKLTPSILSGKKYSSSMQISCNYNLKADDFFVLIALVAGAPYINID